MKVLERFEQCYLGDAGIQRVVLDVDKQICTFELDRAALLKESQALFDWKTAYRPAQLRFHSVRKIYFPEGYYLNYCIVDYSVTLAEPEGYYLFSLTMTGGWDQETFIRKIEILAKDFSLSGKVSEPSPET